LNTTIPQYLNTKENTLKTYKIFEAVRIRGIQMTHSEENNTAIDIQTEQQKQIDCSAANRSITKGFKFVMLMFVCGVLYNCSTGI
jgi:hypothetical protein